MKRKGKQRDQAERKDNHPTEGIYNSTDMTTGQARSTPYFNQKGVLGHNYK